MEQYAPFPPPSPGSKDRFQRLRTWLDVLIAASVMALAGDALNLLALFQLPAYEYTSFLTSSGALVKLIALFALSPVQPRFRKAAIFCCVGMVFSLLSIFAPLGIVAGICSWIVVYQEYSAHAELSREHSPRISGQWHTLFNWYFFVSIICSLLSFFVLLVFSSDTQDLYSLANAVSVIPQIANPVLILAYLLHLIRTRSLFRQENNG